MKVSIKSFDVEMEIKRGGVEFGVRDIKGNGLGSFIVTKTGLIWCKGRTTRANGKQVDWSKFIEWIQLN